VADLDHTQVRTAVKAPAPQITTGGKPSRTVAFEDKFKSQDPGWGVNKDSASSFVDGQLAIKAQPNKVGEQFYPTLVFKSATVCTHLRSPTQMNDSDGTSQGGLVFWGINRTNYYTTYFYPNGTIGIWRMVNSSWAKIIGSVKSDAIKTGLGAVNEVMV